MKRTLQVAAALVALAGIGLWLSLGAGRGWTKTSLAIERVDPVTDIRYSEYKKGFFPGVDFLAASLMVSAALFGSSWLVRRKN
ncbi:MAG: hypothetical protein H7X97_00205 [Opitutaceae bacterium]|nr:hypothetical protein [Verrucomicrobiales bacterium]